MAVSEPSVRLVLQRCESARLQVKPASDADPAEYVSIGRGVIVYLGFYRQANAEIVEKIAKLISTVRVCESPDGKLTSIGELPGDLLLIPQFCLAGRAKGRLFQYHAAIDKVGGAGLYEGVVERCRDMLGAEEKWTTAGCRVECGTYGNRQVLSTETNGPYTHVVDL